MTAQRTEEQTQIIQGFLLRFMRPGSEPGVFYSKITDGDATARLNTFYEGTSLEGFFTEAKVQRARVEKWGASKRFTPPVTAQPAPALPAVVPPVPEPPVPDAVGCFWKRLDAITLDLGELKKDLGEHRGNNAKMIEDVMAEVQAVKKTVAALAKVWDVKE